MVASTASRTPRARVAVVPRHDARHDTAIDRSLDHSIDRSLDHSIDHSIGHSIDATLPRVAAPRRLHRASP
jgi:hypothetical protein